jgi:hypothetical protein
MWPTAARAERAGGLVENDWFTIIWPKVNWLARAVGLEPWYRSAAAVAPPPAAPAPAPAAPAPAPAAHAPAAAAPAPAPAARAPAPAAPPPQAAASPAPAPAAPAAAPQCTVAASLATPWQNGNSGPLNNVINLVRADARAAPGPRRTPAVASSGPGVERLRNV